MSPFEKCPPPALDAERALLSALMGGIGATEAITAQDSLAGAAKACAHCRATLPGPQAFFDARHAAIYETILDLGATGVQTDPVSVKNALQARTMLEQVNGGEGADYFAVIVESVPNAASHVHHARLVLKAHRIREEALRLDRERAALNVSDWEPEDSTPPPAREWQPFPVEVLPEPLRGFVEEVAESVGTDPAFPVSALLPALASAIGNSRALHIKDGWDEPAIIWAAIVADSGTKKSPALEPCLEPIKRRQIRAMRDHEDRMKEYEAEQQRYEKAKTEWGRAKGDTPPPTAPEKPVAARQWTGEATPEAVAALLKSNPRGMLLFRDELAGWLSGFDKYRGGGEAAQWIECFGARAMLVDRKHSGILSIPRASVSVCGGIQPGRLCSLLTKEHRDSGLAARLLFTLPPRRPRVWSDVGISEASKDRFCHVFTLLQHLDMPEDEDGTPAPARVSLSPDALEAFKVFSGDAGAKIDETVDKGGNDLAAAFSKLEGYAARFALVLHLAKWAATPSAVDERVVDLQSMEAGIRLSRWYAGEAERIYAMLDAGEAATADEKLLVFIRKRGGSVSASDIRKNGPAPFQRGDVDPEKALARLVKKGLGHFEDRRPNGRTVRMFILKPSLRGGVNGVMG